MVSLQAATTRLIANSSGDMKVPPSVAAVLLDAPALQAQALQEDNSTSHPASLEQALPGLQAQMTRVQNQLTRLQAMIAPPTTTAGQGVTASPHTASTDHSQADAIASSSVQLQQTARLLEIRQALVALVYDNLHPFTGTVRSCGFLPPARFVEVMSVLAQAAQSDILPKRVIGVGSGLGLIEKCFDIMGCTVTCYDREPCDSFIPVQQAEFPQDIARCLPEDCRNYLLLAAFPQGYLGPILAEFVHRGGSMLCTTVEKTLFSDMHQGYEQDPALLQQAIKALQEKRTGHFFQVELTSGSMLSAGVRLQFYNGPERLKKLLQETPELRRLCSTIELDS